MKLWKLSAFAAGSLAFIFSVGGCPSDATLALESDLSADNSADPTIVGDTENPTRSLGSSTTVPGSGLDSSFATQLAARFPECEEPADSAAMEAEILRLVNAERAKSGLGEVVRNETLVRQAEQYACEMVQFDFFDHVNPITGSTLGDRSRDFEYDFQVVGENLAAGQRTASQAFIDWMNSPGHRKNIMDPRFTELGVAVKLGGEYGVYWVQEFGRPAR